MDTNPHFNRWLIVLVVFLLITSLIQTSLLIRQSWRQNRTEKIQQAVAKAELSHPSGTPQNPARWPMRHSTQFAHDPFTSSPWDEMEAVSKRMDSLMRHAFTFGSPLMTGLIAEDGFDYTPAIDIEDTPVAYIVKSDLPGLEKDKISISIKNNMLTIEGVRETSSEQKNDKAGYYAQERSYGSFSRSVPLPGPVDEANIKADYKNGVLMITLPKIKEAPAPQKIAVQ